MKILVLGVSGMLGHQLFLQGMSRPQHQLMGTLRSKACPAALAAHSGRLVCGFEANNPTDVEKVMSAFRPDVVMNAVGLIRQSAECEDPVSAIRTNSLLPHMLRQKCDEHGARLIHISTDCVFSGMKGSYTESDNPDPSDLYGRSKLLGESENAKHITIRSSLIGHELERRSGLLEWFLNSAGPFKGFSKAFFSGFTTLEFARILFEHVIPHPKIGGIIHVASDRISKYALLKLIGEIYRKKAAVAEDSSVLCDRTLNGSRFVRLTGYAAPSWTTMITEMREDYLMTMHANKGGLNERIER